MKGQPTDRLSQVEAAFARAVDALWRIQVACGGSKMAMTPDGVVELVKERLCAS